jgi:hypothetical protein
MSSIRRRRNAATQTRKFLRVTSSTKVNEFALLSSKTPCDNLLSLRSIPVVDDKVCLIMAMESVLKDAWRSRLSGLVVIHQQQRRQAGLQRLKIIRWDEITVHIMRSRPVPPTDVASTGSP